MIQLFYTNPKTLVTTEMLGEWSGGTDLDNRWLHLTNPTDREIELVARCTGASEDFLKAALDEEEKARIDVEDSNTLTIFDIPIIEEEDNYYTYGTLPFGVVITKNCIISVCLKETSLIQSLIAGRVKNFMTAKKTRLLYQLLYFTHTKYQNYLKQIDKATQRIQDELVKSTKNKALLQMLDLEKSLLYFSTSLRGNGFIIDKLSKTTAVRKYEEDEELLEDVAIENRQAIEMCNIYREVLSVNMDAWGSIINNNMNSIMKLLTSITFVISVPTMISGLWGMNTGVPFEGKSWGFWVATGIAGLAATIASIILHKKKML